MVRIQFDNRLLRTDGEQDMPVRQRLNVMAAFIRLRPKLFARRPFHRDDLAFGPVVGNQDLSLRRRVLQMFVEERESALVGPFGVGSFETMAGARDRFEFCGNSGGDQSLCQPNRMFVGDVCVLCPVDRQSRARLAASPNSADWIAGALPIALQIAAEEQGQHLGRIHALRVRLREIR